MCNSMHACIDDGVARRRKECDLKRYSITQSVPLLDYIVLQILFSDLKRLRHSKHASEKVSTTIGATAVGVTRYKQIQRTTC
jgi:hypothetical protein